MADFQSVHDFIDVEDQSNIDKKERLRIVSYLMNRVGFENATSNKVMSEDAFESAFRSIKQDKTIIDKLVAIKILFRNSNSTRRTIESVDDLKALLNSLLNRYGLQIKIDQEKRDKQQKTMYIIYTEIRY